MKVLYLETKKRPYIEYADDQLFKIMSNQDKNHPDAVKAFTEFSIRYSGYLFKHCFIKFKSTEIAVDITRDTLYKAFINAHKFIKGRGTKSWLSTIAVNAYIDQLRGKKDINVEIIETYNDIGSSEEQEIWLTRKPIEKELFEKAWNSLEEHKRVILEAYLRHFDVNDFRDNIRLPEQEVTLLLKAFPNIIKNKYYIPKLRNRAWEELYNKCQIDNQKSP